MQTIQITSMLLGSFVGVTLALTGAGGAIIAVPLLIFGLHLAVAEASPYCAACREPVGCHWRHLDTGKYSILILLISQHSLKHTVIVSCGFQHRFCSHNS